MNEWIHMDEGCPLPGRYIVYGKDQDHRNDEGYVVDFATWSREAYAWECENLSVRVQYWIEVPK